MPADAVAAGGGCIAGMLRPADGIALIQDLDRVLSLEEERALDLALAQRAGR